MQVLCKLCHGKSHYSDGWQPHSIFTLGLSIVTLVFISAWALVVDGEFSGALAFISFAVLFMFWINNIVHTRRAIKRDDLSLVTLLSAILTVISGLLLFGSLAFLALRPDA